jgi:CubicO group peptidase (beta-lactamase class C family)
MLHLLLAASILAKTEVDRIPLEGNALFGKFTSDWNQRLSQSQVPSLGIGIVKNGKVALLDSIGMSDPFAQRKATIDTRYYIASISKTMTAAAVLRLSEQGKLSLEDKVQKYLPKFELADQEYGRTLTIRDLLSHAPGIDAQTSFLEAKTGGITDERFYGLLRLARITKKPRYANIHFTLLGRVIEAVTGVPWQDYLAKNVYDSIGMSRSTSRLADLRGDLNLAGEFSLTPGGLNYATYTKSESTMHAAGGTYSTPRDMTRYMLALLNHGSLDSQKLLSAESVADALELHSEAEDGIANLRIKGFGYAWHVASYRDRGPVLVHTGQYVGSVAAIFLLPRERSGVVLLLNSGTPTEIAAFLVAMDALDVLMGLERDNGAQEDLAKRLSEAVQQTKSRAIGIGPNPAMSGLLSLLPQAFEGAYENQMFGNVKVDLLGGYLRLSIDQLPTLLKSTGVDEFTFHEDSRDGGRPGRFVTENGRCVAVELQIAGRWERFSRKI